MGLFDKIKEPVILKESSSAQKQLAALYELREQAREQLKKKIEQEVKIVEAGILGENQIMFELKNSHIPMAVLHDLYFEKDGYTAQIDFLIITRGRIFILECKNLIGNIDIDSSGNFTRTLSYGRAYHKEGVYSPVTQNQRHMDIIKKIRMEAKTNILTRSLFEKNFGANHRSVVVLANPKTVLNARYAPKEVRDQVIRADQLIAYMKRVNAEKDAEFMSEKEMMHLANFYLERSIENPADYLKKYEKQFETDKPWEVHPEPVKHGEQKNAGQQDENGKACPRCGAPMVKRKAGKGPNAGKEFYGCTKFPQCRGIININ